MIGLRISKINPKLVIKVDSLPSNRNVETGIWEKVEHSRNVFKYSNDLSVYNSNSIGSPHDHVG